ncbi:MAG: diguanylate cyclase [Acidobacteriota bacterium]|nr:diguanylate cyclase [Acidobacteriota bacterium]
MEDPRFESYLRATEAMGRGQFDVEMSVSGHDEVARLGEALLALAENLRSRFDEVARLSRIAERVNAGLVLEEVLDQIFDSFRSVIPYERIGLGLLDADGDVLRSRWSRSELGKIRLGRGFAAPMAGSSLEEIIRTGRPRILNDLEDYLRRKPESEATRLIVEEGFRSSLTCPLVALGKPIGFLFFSSREKNTYGEIHQGHFLQLAGQVSVILEKSRLYQELLDLNRRLQEARLSLQHEASHDALTGLWNRRAVLQLLAREMARAAREELTLAAIILDLDYFKAVNDEYGHLVGDEVLKEVSRRLVASLRSADFIGRLGGEEFLVILCSGDQASAEEVMERTRQVCAATPIATSAGEIPITISLGAGTASGLEGVEPTTLLTAADRALYRAKNGGRNRCEVERLASA